MGALAAIKQLVSSLLIFAYALAALFSRRSGLHSARFARIDELAALFTAVLDKEASLLLAISHLRQVLRVRPTRKRRELGNLLVVAPTRGGKGLLATSQLLTWRHSVVVNDIKGDIFSQTAGYRKSLGPVFCLDPTGVGHAFDPLLNKQGAMRGNVHKEDKCVCRL